MPSTSVSLTCLIVFCLSFKNAIAQGELGGPAELIIKSIESCPEPDQYKYSINVVRRKINRTHEAFDGTAELGTDLDEKVGIHITVAKKASDGYKPNAYDFQHIHACVFFMQNLGQSYLEMLQMIGEPQQCPLKAGSYSLKGFLMDHRKLPGTLPYGDFRVDAFFIKDGEKVLCTRAFLQTKAKVLPIGR